MYCEYFGLKEFPFSIAPNPRYLFMSEQHEEALSHLLYGVAMEGSFILLTGEVGTGKTTLSRHLINQLPDTTNFALILNPQLEPVELLQAICDELCLDSHRVNRNSVNSLCSLISDYLLKQHAEGRNTLLIIDEGQQLSVASLEQIRLLTNLETDETKLLKVVLLGQPELLAKLAREDLRQLSQRISARFHLGPLPEADLPLYVQHRLHIAGLRRPVFPAATIRNLYRLSSGLPRVINQICDRALLGTYVQNQNEVTVETLQKAAKEVLGKDTPMPGEPKRSLVYWMVLAIVLGLSGWGAGFGLSLIFNDQLKMDALFASGWFAQKSANTNGEGADLERVRQKLFPWEKTALANLPPTSAGNSVGQAISAMDGKAVTLLDKEMTGEEEAFERALSEASDWISPEDSDLAEVLAYIELFSIWHLDYDPRKEPVVCDFAARHQLGCLTQQGTLSQLAGLNRPAVITLRVKGQEYQALLVGLTSERASLIVNAQARVMPAALLERLWGGRYTLLWYQPPEYKQPIWPGTQGRAVSWLNQELARQRGEEAAPKLKYDAQLFLQVKAFQQQQGLLVDGVAGPFTLIKLNSLLRPDLPRLNTQREG